MIQLPTLYSLELPDDYRSRVAPVVQGEAKEWHDDFIKLRTTVETEHGSDGWFEQRRWSLGGSDVPVLYGEANHRTTGGREVNKTIEELIDEKVRGIKTFEGNRWTYWGEMVEPAIVQHLVNNFAGPVWQDKNHVYCHPIYHNLRASVDALGFMEDMQTYILFEIKTTAYSQRAKVKEAPARKHWLQVQHTLGVLGLKDAVMVYLVGGNELFVHDIVFDEEWWDDHLNVTTDFFNRLDRAHEAFQLSINSRDF